MNKLIWYPLILYKKEKLSGTPIITEYYRKTSTRCEQEINKKLTEKTTKIKNLPNKQHKKHSHKIVYQMEVTSTWSSLSFNKFWKRERIQAYYQKGQPQEVTEQFNKINTEIYTWQTQELLKCCFNSNPVPVFSFGGLQLHILPACHNNIIIIMTLMPFKNVFSSQK